MNGLSCLCVGVAGCNDELKGKAKRRFKGRAKLEQGDDKDEDNEGVDEMGMGGAMSIMQVESLLNLLNNLLSALLKVLQKVSLSQSDESQHTLASQTVTLIHLFFSQRPRELSKTLKVNLCFQVLGTYLTNPVQQTSLRQDSRLFKFLKPLVLMKNPTDGSVQPNLTQNVVKAAEQCVSFLKQVMTQKKTVCQCVFVLAQHMVLEVVDRVEYRYKTANLFVSLVVSLPEKMYSALLEWLFYKLTSTKQNERLFVLDILESLLNYVCNSGEHRGLDLNKETLVENVLERCSDKVPSIRAKALSCVSALCALKNSQVSGILQSKLTTMGDKKVVFDKSSVTVNEELIEDDEALDEAEETKDDFNLFFSKRCRDEKFIVRKAALKAYTDVVEGMREQFEKVDQSCLTAALTEAAVDVSLMIRKQSIDSISQLLNAFRMNQTFQHTWLSIVMPMFVDTERSVVEKASAVFEETVLKPLCDMRGDSSTLVEDDSERVESGECFKLQLSCSLIDVLVVSDNLMHFFRRGLTSLAVATLEARVPELIACLKGNCARKVSCLMLLSQVMQFHQNRAVFDATIAEFGEDFLSRSVSNEQDQLPFNITLDMGVHATEKRFTLNYILDIFVHVTDKIVEKSEMEQVVNSLVACASKTTTPFHCSADILSAVQIICEQFSLTDILKDFAVFTSKNTKIAIENFLQDLNMGKVTLEGGNLSQKLFLVGQLALCNLCEQSDVSSALKSFLKVLLKLMKKLSSERSEGKHVLREDVIASIEAVSVIAIGNMCLVFEDCARQGAEILGSLISPQAREGAGAEGELELELELELEDRQRFRSLKVANNAIIVLCNLCKRYTHKVEKFLPRIYRYLGCADSFIRFQTLASVFDLLTNDYIKMRDSLFFRMTTLYVDECDKVASLCEYCLEHIAHKHKNLFFSHFVELFFFLNESSDHPQYNKFPSEGHVSSGLADGDSFGAEEDTGMSSNQEKRLLIYQLMARSLTEQQKFQLKCRLMADILGVYIKEERPLSPAFDAIMSDVFKMLVMKAMKSNCLSREVADTAESSLANNDDGSSCSSTATKLAELVKETTLEQFVPIMLGLREKLMKENKTALLNDQLAFFADLIKEHKNEFKARFKSKEAESIESDVRKSANFTVRHYHKRASSPGTFDRSISTTFDGGAVSTRSPWLSSSISSRSSSYFPPRKALSRSSSGDVSVYLRDNSICMSPVFVPERESSLSVARHLTPILEASQEAALSSQNVCSQAFVDDEDMTTSTPCAKKDDS